MTYELIEHLKTLVRVTPQEEAWMREKIHNNESDYIQFLTWIDEKSHYSKVNRMEFFIVMEFLRQRFEDNNEVSRKMSGICWTVDFIEINEDVIKTQDIPQIKYVLINGHVNVMEVRRNHKIVWSILRKCQAMVK